MTSRKQSSSKDVNGNVVSVEFGEKKEEQRSRILKWKMLTEERDEVDLESYLQPRERLSEMLGYMCHFLDEHVPDAHPLYCYQKDEFPRDIEMSKKYEAIKDYPRDFVDAWLLQDCVECGYCKTHGDEFLTKVFRKCDSIRKQANKQWLRFLVKECHEHGVFDEEGDAANIVS